MAALRSPTALNQRPLAFCCLEIRNIGEVFPDYEYFCSAVHLTRLGEDVLDRSLVVIAVRVASIDPIDTILRDGDRKWRIGILIGRRYTDDPHRGVESSSDNFFTDFAVGYKAILNFKVEPDT